MVDGETLRILVIHFKTDNMTLHVPVMNAAKVGLRKLADEPQLRDGSTPSHEGGVTLEGARAASAERRRIRLLPAPCGFEFPISGRRAEEFGEFAL